MPDDDLTALGLSPVLQAAVRSMVVRMTREAVRAMLEEAQRLGLQWGLRPATVSDRPGTDPARVPVAYDGPADDAVPVMSMIGVPAAGARVMVAAVPPAGAYIVGWAGGPTRPVLRSVITATDDWEKPALARVVMVEVLGGGGAGGGADAAAAGQHSMGAGGGAGEWAQRLYLATDLPDTVTVTIGAGGTGVSGGTGNAGGNTTFGALLTAAGGSGAGMRPAEAISFGVGGAAGGSGGAGTADIRAPGAPGGSAWGDATLCVSGEGGSSFYGGGGRPRDSGAGGASQTGLPGGGFGAGGGGAQNNSGGASNRAGGAGTDGLAVVTSFL